MTAVSDEMFSSEPCAASMDATSPTEAVWQADSGVLVMVDISEV